MRRPAPILPVSPKMLKHFAAATVAITGLLALFVGGEDASIAAQVQATSARNDLVASHKNKSGAGRIASSLKVRNPNSGGFDSDGPSDFGAGDGGGGSAGVARSGPPMIKSQGPVFLPPANLSRKPGGTTSKKRLAKPGDPEDSGDSAGGDGPAGGSGASGQPDSGQLGAAIEASRMRSGSADRAGD
jgi:hypothetical protein